MYSHHHHQGNNIVSSRTAFPSERHLFLQGGNVQGESGLVLSTDAKPRLKWTAELHERFIEAVSQLGGADKATPKTVMRLMGIPGLTLYHLKSHLQKYRLSKNLQSQSNTGTPKTAVDCSALAAEITPEVNGPITGNKNIGVQPNKTIHINEALQMQIEVQRRLHEQLEVQRHLQLRIEAQGKYLQSVLEKAQETLGKQNSGSAGIEATKVQLSELVSKVSNECFTTLADSSLHTLADCSMDSCLTTCEGSQKDQEIHNISVGLRTYHRNSPVYTQQMGEDARLDQSQPAWCEALNDHKTFSSTIAKDQERAVFSVQRDSSILTMSITGQSEKDSSGTVAETRRRGRDEFGMSHVTTQLDLNAHDDDGTVQTCKMFDLNGLSWS